MAGTLSYPKMSGPGYMLWFGCHHFNFLLLKMRNPLLCLALECLAPWLRLEASPVEDPVDSPNNNIPMKPRTFTKEVFCLVMMVGLAIGVAVKAGIAIREGTEPIEFKMFNKILERVRDDGQVKERIGLHITAGNWKYLQKWIDDDGNGHMVANFDICGQSGAGTVYSEMLKDNVEDEWKYKYLNVEITSPSPVELILEPYDVTVNKDIHGFTGHPLLTES